MKNKRFVNAGIKTIEEAIKRLMDGEAFYSAEHNHKIKYDPTVLNSSPFRFDTEPLKDYFGQYEEWLKKADWRGTLDEKPVLCWVWDGENEDSKLLIVVVEYRKGHEYPYFANKGYNYEFAEPATLESIKDLLLEEVPENRNDISNPGVKT